MYLNRAFIRNLGPIENLDISLECADDQPIPPLVVVGSNGSGKSHLLSLIADALFEAAAKTFNDVLPDAPKGGRQWFRVVGGGTRTTGASYSTALLNFSAANQSYKYIEKSGEVPKEIIGSFPEEFSDYSKHFKNELVKHADIVDEMSREQFLSGAYCYFPASRSELPHWLNIASVQAAEGIGSSQRYSQQLAKPIFLERSMEDLAQWLAILVADCRMQFTITVKDKTPQFVPIGDIGQYLQSIQLLDGANGIIREILSDPTAQFTWLGRKSASKVGVARAGNRPILSLKALSSGQATLLSIFGTLLRYGQSASKNFVMPADVEGICLVDEIDAHMHVELQHKAIPALMKMFPKVQFIVSCHSPILLLGLSKNFGDNINLLEMPSGNSVDPESYSEFSNALAAFRATKTFEDQVSKLAGRAGKPLILTEGETDPTYLKTAFDLLGHGEYLTRVDIEWIGHRSPKGAVNTGTTALDHAKEFLLANSSFAQRKIVLLYDNDTKKQKVDSDQIYVRVLPDNPNNEKIQHGIENLLDERAILKFAFETNETRKPNGEHIVRTHLNKMKLCMHLCEKRRRRSDFLQFEPVIQSLLATLFGDELSSMPKDLPLT